MRILTWNIGCFSFLKYFKYFGIKCGGNKVMHEYFNPKLNADFVSSRVQELNPDVLILQEIFYKEDVKDILSLNTYSHQTLVNTWYHEHSILIASRVPHSVRQEGSFYVVSIGGFDIIPVHLHSFSASKRLQDIDCLSGIMHNHNNMILLGDTNIWQRSGFFMFSKDKKAYFSLLKSLVDVSSSILSTTYLGFSLDKIFCTKDIKVKSITAPKIRSHFMDHYPVYLDLE